jgi:uncharacterized protein (TIGR02145 family)
MMKYLVDITFEVLTWCHPINEGTVAATIKYGLLYNWYAVGDPRYISSIGWHIPTYTDFETLVTYLGGELVAGGKLKETGTTYWNAPNLGATNEFGFNGRGGGYREDTFYNILNFCPFWGSQVDIDFAYIFQLSSIDEDLSLGFSALKKSGGSVRLIKDSTILTEGQTGFYIGNDLKTYNTICIGSQEWLSQNLAEKKYRNGDVIPEVTNDIIWWTLSTDAWCYYNNDPANM